MSDTPEHTEGPWKWDVNPHTHSVVLVGGAPMRPHVMKFARYGMQGAQPVFRVDGRMTKASEIAEPEPGREHHADWHRVINHPDARLIAAAPDLLEAAKDFIDFYQSMMERPPDELEELDALRRAIAKAEGRKAEADHA